MYQQTDKKSAVREVQTYLYVLSDRMYNDIPRIPIDGIFDKETEEAVIQFQNIKLLAPSGIVDLETFNALYEDYLKVVEDFYTADYIFGDGNFPLKENDQNEDVRALHIMINELRKEYPQIPPVGTGSYFSKRTVDAIEEIRSLFLMQKSPRLDKELYKRILAEIHARNRFNEKNK